MNRIFFGMAAAIAIVIAAAPYALASTEAEVTAARNALDQEQTRLRDAEDRLSNAPPDSPNRLQLQATVVAANRTYNEAYQRFTEVTRQAASARLDRENQPAGGARDGAGGGGATQAGGAGQGNDPYSFGRNSMGRAGNRVVEASRNCGTGAGREGCEKVAKRIETLSNISDYADYAGYAAVAGTVLPAMIASPDQKKDQLMAAQIQEVAGYVNIAAGITDIGVGVLARSGSANELERIKNQERVNCAPFQLSARGTAPRTPEGVTDETEACQRFRSGQSITGAVEEIKSASNTHYVMGGLKAVGGVAALYLAKQSRQNAKDLETLESQKKEEPAPTNTPQTISTTPGNSGVSNNTVSFVAPDETAPSTTPGSGAYTAPRVTSSGGSAAPISGNPASYGARRSGGGGGGAGGGAPAGGSLGASTGGASSDPGLGEDPEQAADGQPSDWAGGGGSLNQGSMSLGSGDGGFGNLLGSMAGMFGGGEGGAASSALTLDRGPASAAPAQQSGGVIEDSNTTLFQRVSGAIGRQVRSGQIVNSTADANKI